VDVRSPITPLPRHRGRHAAPIALGLLATAIVLVWTSPDDDRPSDDPRPAVASLPPAREELAPIELGRGAATAVVAEREVLRVIDATGPVTFDPERTHHVRSPVAGIVVKTRASSRSFATSRARSCSIASGCACCAGACARSRSRGSSAR
jgi:hypothetical protein